MKAFTSFAGFMENILPTLAPKDSPIFLGNPQAPTPAQTSSSTYVATTEFVKRAMANLRGEDHSNSN